MTESSHGGLMGDRGHGQGQAVDSSSDLALSGMEWTLGSHPRS
jgi:hypothetical protein